MDTTKNNTLLRQHSSRAGW